MWLETDLEPDDVLAIYTLPKRSVKWVVVGEGNASIKAARLNRYHQLLEQSGHCCFQSALRIIKGEDSDKQFPGDGQEFDDLDVESEARRATYSYRYKYDMELWHFIDQNDDPVMISLKPMRELVEWYKSAPDVAGDLLSKVTWYVYGGFNFRCIDDKEALLQMMGRFKRVYIYESYHATAEQNSVNRINSPQLYTLLTESNNGFIDALSRITRLWNGHIVQELKNSNSERAKKVVASVTGNEQFQYVLADFALTSLIGISDAELTGRLQHIGAIRFDSNGYISFQETTDGTILLYKNLGFEYVYNIVVRAIKRRVK